MLSDYDGQTFHRDSKNEKIWSCTLSVGENSECDMTKLTRERNSAARFFIKLIISEDDDWCCGVVLDFDVKANVESLYYIIQRLFVVR